MSEHDTIWIEPKKLLAFIVVMIAILAMSWAYWFGYHNGVKDTVKKNASCQEDEACWDCKTMGNKVCGDPTTPVVVNMPGCMMEPSNTPEGYEIIQYDSLWHGEVYQGFSVPCPK